MRIPKRYGQSKIEVCPFCGKTATTKNSQEVPVCVKHKHERLPDLRCICGSYLELKNGKFGVYFNCMSCGNMSMEKALSMNPNTNEESDGMGTSKTAPIKNNKGASSSKKDSTKETKKEITITSEQVDLYYS